MKTNSNSTSPLYHNPVNPCYPIYSVMNQRPPGKSVQTLYFKLLRKWDLSEDERVQLDYYKLQKVSALDLSSHLQRNYGKIIRNNICFQPIYQNCTKTQINQSVGAYWISYRKKGEFSIALIQPVK